MEKIDNLEIDIIANLERDIIQLKSILIEPYSLEDIYKPVIVTFLSNKETQYLRCSHNYEPQSIEHERIQIHVKHIAELILEIANESNYSTYCKIIEKQNLLDKIKISIS
jgi:hypothetical protein